MSELTIRKLMKSTVFCDEFQQLTNNNIIQFSAKGIAVIYGPNGTGKTSLASVFKGENLTEFVGELDGAVALTGENGIFHVIADQNKRNIIEGKTEDFVLGDDIRREQELFKKINKDFETLRSNILLSCLKNEFNITKKNSKLIDFISNADLQVFVKDIANKSSKGSGITVDEFIRVIRGLTFEEIGDYDEDKFLFFIQDIEKAESILLKILGLNEDLVERNAHIKEVEENNDAIKILNKYMHKNECIVCDYQIDPADKLNTKTENRDNIIDRLADNIKSVINSISNMDMDPFSIKETLYYAIETGDFSIVVALQDEICEYSQVFSRKINNLFMTNLRDELVNEVNEYNEMLNRQLVISGEDIQYIEDVLNDNLDKKIKLERKEGTREIKLLLGEDEFLQRDRRDLSLSAGEQNFVSLTFELLKAKNSDKPIVILDDPISSFDSIYKNKIAFAIIKFLEYKKQIIMTHNTDLIRLLDCQQSNCFNLYIFNNVHDEDNGFIKVEACERGILIYIDKLLKILRTDIFEEVIDEKNFLISLIPFMRGYAKLIGNDTIKNSLTCLMHGYCSEIININEVYLTLFNRDIQFTNTHNISVDDILSINVDEFDVLSDDRYPLLNRTLKHSLTYLFLRLKVEKVLVDTFDIDTTRYELLGDIIRMALEGDENTRRRIFFMSRKTLLNEFNHFEGNMNIFQPAIDISNLALKKEKDDILRVLQEIIDEQV